MAITESQATPTHTANGAAAGPVRRSGGRRESCDTGSPPGGRKTSAGGLSAVVGVVPGRLDGHLPRPRGRWRRGQGHLGYVVAGRDLLFGNDRPGAEDDRSGGRLHPAHRTQRVLLRTLLRFRRGGLGLSFGLCLRPGVAGSLLLIVLAAVVPADCGPLPPGEYPGPGPPEPAHDTGRHH